MSNFAHTPFTLDGVEYASVEGFYAAILIQNNENKKAKVRTYWGIRAKHAIPNTRPAEFEYRGELVRLGSPEHHALIKRAIHAKLEAHPTLLEAFMATAPRPLIHETGYPPKGDSEFPSEVFCRILTELRHELSLGHESK